MERKTDGRTRRRRGRWLRWVLMMGVVLGVGLTSRSVSALLARVDQLEREAAESEARVEELQVLRDGMSRRLRQMEQQLQTSPAPGSAQAKKRPALTR